MLYTLVRNIATRKVIIIFIFFALTHLRNSLTDYLPQEIKKQHKQTSQLDLTLKPRNMKTIQLNVILETMESNPLLQQLCSI